MNIFELFTILLGISVFNLLVLVVSVLLFFRSKKTIEYSSQTLNAVSEFDRATAANIEKRAHEILEKMLAQYGNTFQDISSWYLKSVQTSADEQMKALSAHLRDQEAQITQQGTFVMQKVIEDAQVEIDQYKKIRMKQIEDVVPKIVERASKEVLNKSFDISLHEDLVWSALEKAKASGIFAQGPLSESANVKKVSKISVLPKTTKVKAVQTVKKNAKRS